MQVYSRVLVLFGIVLYLLPSTLGADDSAAGITHSTGAEDTGGGCVGTDRTVIAAVNASQDYMLEMAIVNCLSFKDNASSISFGVVSYTLSAGGSSSGRSTVECVNDKALVVVSSMEMFSNDSISCYECKDMSVFDMCPNNATCVDKCQYCYGPSQTECLTCDTGRYEGMCVDMCPVETTPNPANGNECECPGYFSGTNCTVCDHYCPSTYYLNQTTCTCTTCPDGFLYELRDYNASAPASVIGEPLDEDCEPHHEKKRASEDDHHGGGSESALEDEDLVCVRNCQLPNYEPDRDGICYACGIQYCLECVNVGQLNSECQKCRPGTLLTDHYECLGFYEEICERAIHFEEHVEEEEEDLKEYQLHLKISLPIVCTAVVFTFFGLAVIAHFRYPHVGHQKRHRKPNKTTEQRSKTEFERALRPQSTVIFR